MIRTLLAVGTLTLCNLIFSQSVLAQGAAQAVRGAAAGLQGTVDESQKPLTAGPEDSQEKTKPGKIDDGVSKEFKTTASGLKYRILRKTDGRKPDAGSGVEVNYKGWFDDLSIFDSSYRRGKSIEFKLSQVIPGWTEGVQLMGEGEMIELVIPYQLAYGERGRAGIPPKSQLHFIIELISVK